MHNQNPYSLTFGRQPSEIIPRFAQTQEVLDMFLSERPPQQIYMVTGVRGSGKTVFMTSIAKELKERDDWVVVELNPERDLLLSLAAKLSSDNALAQIFRNAKINLSFWGFGLEIESDVQITDIETALTKMIESLKKHHKRLFIAIDEVVNTPNIRTFASAFQIFLRQDLPVFLLMTGLYENIDVLQNEKSLTFLYRAPKIVLAPLRIGTIAENYKSVLGVDDEHALNMARSTKGYSFAFQVLGYFTWKYKDDEACIQADYKHYLDEFVYEKIWKELSNLDRRVLYGIAKTSNGTIKNVREVIGMSTNQFNPYRQRLIRRGLIDGSKFGHVTFTLPLFKRFVLENYFAEDEDN